MLVGFAEPAAESGDSRRAHNATAVLADGAVRAVYRKNRLPNYAVFDEQRYFVPGTEPLTVEVGGLRVGLTICEDVWVPGPPAATEAEQGATLIANPSGSPYHRGKGHERVEMFAARSRAYGDLLRLLQPGRRPGRARLRRPEPGHRPRRRADRPRRPVRGGAAGLRDPRRAGPARIAEPLADLDEVYGALVLGLRDYVAKNGFRHVGVALSGGIDSALVALLAADAVGPERLSCVVMPSPHSSSATQGDARTIAANLGCELIEIPIEPMMEGYARALDAPAEPDLAAENIQARIRGNLMMALSNRHGWLVLTTGNKSEMSVGYATLYGDMAGGFAVIKDVPKGLVYELTRRRNERAGTRAGAGLGDRPRPLGRAAPRPARQRLPPPYDLLDRILEAYVERDQGREEMIAAGMPAATVDDVIRLVDRSEYKRRQAAPGIRITPRAFGKDRRLPITNRFGG